jgi:hypothetical protein
LNRKDAKKRKAKQATEKKTAKPSKPLKKETTKPTLLRGVKPQRRKDA